MGRWDDGKAGTQTAGCGDGVGVVWVLCGCRCHLTSANMEKNTAMGGMKPQRPVLARCAGGGPAARPGIQQGDRGGAGAGISYEC